MRLLAAALLLVDLLLATACERLVGIEDLPLAPPDGGVTSVPDARLAPSDATSVVSIPAARFDRNNDSRYPAQVSAFELDRHEVSVARFRVFVKDGRGTRQSPPPVNAGEHPIIGADTGWNASWDVRLAPDSVALVAFLHCGAQATYGDAPAAGTDDLPINCVTWYEAFAFCAWDGGRLPTAAEWSAAASGGAEQRLYPWGAGLDHAHAVYGCEADGGPCGAPAAAGSRAPLGDSAQGASDLAGNVGEWVLDGHDPPPLPCVDCASLAGVAEKDVRGGAFGDKPADVGSAAVRAVLPVERRLDVGFRCARP